MRVRTLIALGAVLSMMLVHDAGALIGDAKDLPCVDIVAGEVTADYLGAASGSVLDFDVTLDGPSCEDATYTLFVTADSGHRSDVPGGENATVALKGNGSNVLSYAVEIDDNDTTVCVHSETIGTLTTGGPVDENGNGVVTDDQHRNNDGNNKDGTKHDWEETTTTVTDRAPDKGCLIVSPFNELPPLPGQGGGARGYN